MGYRHPPLIFLKSCNVKNELTGLESVSLKVFCRLAPTTLVYYLVWFLGLVQWITKGACLWPASVQTKCARDFESPLGLMLTLY